MTTHNINAITDEARYILIEALRMYAENEADDCHDAGEDSLSDEALAISEQLSEVSVNPARVVNLDFVLAELVRISGARADAEDAESDED